MKALLLAAGFGTRLRPLTNSIPKCLVPIGDRPLIDYWLEMIARAGIQKAVVNLHYLNEMVESYLAQSQYNKIVHPVFEEHLLGTGGTLLKNRKFFAHETILMIHADNFSVFDMNAFIIAHENRPKYCEITMMTFKTDHPESCGIVELDKTQVVREFHEKVEKPPGNLANGAVYIMESAVIDFMSDLDSEVIDFSTEVLPHYVGRIFTYHNDVYHRDIGTKESYEKAKKDYSLFY